MEMTALILADVDDLHWRGKIGPADVLISCGDTADSTILEAAKACGCSRIFAVKGNHDSPSHFSEPITDLHLQSVLFKGVVFGGLNGSWKYKPRGHFLYQQSEISRALQGFPRVDVFVSHNSPRGIHDKDDDLHQGFDGLTWYIEQAQPRLVIHGHQHTNAESKRGNTILGVCGYRVVEMPYPG